MKLVRYRTDDGGARVGVVDGDTVHDAGTSLFEIERGDAVGSVDEVALLAPLSGPRKIICIGLNFSDHAEEAGAEVPDEPVLFPKYDNCLVGPGEPIVVPPSTSEVDYEVELGVVIGKRASRVSSEEALDHVLGYTCVNDVSARDLQFRDGQWTRGKAIDTFCPVGPWVVTTDDIPDPQSLGLRCLVNGETLQDSSTANMVHPVADLVSYLSDVITLDPGDLISTGTPAGVGFTRTPPIFLTHGDTVTVEIDGIGALTNPVEDRKP